MVDAIIAHCDAAAESGAEAYRIAPDRIRVIPHGHFADAYPAPSGRHVARAVAALPPDAPAYFSFGRLRPYKGLEDLLDEIAAIESPRSRLIPVGEPSTAALAESLAERITRDVRVEVRIEFVEHHAGHVHRGVRPCHAPLS